MPNKWTLYDKAILTRMYSTGTQEDIVEALENKFNWKAILLQANRMNLIRYGYGGRSGESKYSNNHVYCPKCERFMDREKAENKICPYCGVTKVRDPGNQSTRRNK